MLGLLRGAARLRAGRVQGRRHVPGRHADADEHLVFAGQCSLGIPRLRQITYLLNADKFAATCFEAMFYACPSAPADVVHVLYLGLSACIHETQLLRPHPAQQTLVFLLRRRGGSSAAVPPGAATI